MDDYANVCEMIKKKIDACLVTTLDAQQCDISARDRETTQREAAFPYFIDNLSRENHLARAYLANNR